MNLMPVQRENKQPVPMIFNKNQCPHAGTLFSQKELYGMYGVYR